MTPTNPTTVILTGEVKVATINSAVDSGKNVDVSTMNFSVNRNGSTFWIDTVHTDKYTEKTINNDLDGNYANDKVTVKIHEINVDKVDVNPKHKTIFTLNDGNSSKDVVLVEKNGNSGNYDKNILVGKGGWYETIYSLDNDNFKSDGTYSLNINTYDKANNKNINTKDKTGTIKFTIDRTNPVITSNVESGQTIDKNEFPVEFRINDLNLDEKSVVVKLNNKKIKPESLGNNNYKFVVESGYKSSFEIEANDYAKNSANIYKINDLTV